MKDIQLEQLYEVDYKVCTDECGQQTSKSKVGERPTDIYRESTFVSSGSYWGDPVWTIGMPPSMQTRWGVK